MYENQCINNFAESKFRKTKSMLLYLSPDVNQAHESWTFMSRLSWSCNGVALVRAKRTESTMDD